MPDFVDQLYSSHQITIPPNLPTILKKYAKAAIRTQPQDLLVWSANYFKALTYGIPLPVKERIEFPPVNTLSGLSPGYLKVLINQLGNSVVSIRKEEVAEYWNGVCLSKEALEEIFSVGGFFEQLNWLKFVAICAGYLESSLHRTMVLLCELLTDEPVGGSAHIPVSKFIYLYKYLARLDCGPDGPTKPAGYKSSLDLDLEGVGEALSGEGISYKEERESVKSFAEISWQSVLKRMGKRQSDESVSTVDQDIKCSKDDYLARGIAWERIADIAETEPDTSDTITSSLCQNSSIGLQVFEYLEDKKLKKEVVTEDQKKSGQSQSTLSRSEAVTDLRGNLGEKSLAEILSFVQEFETSTKVKEKGQKIDDDEDDDDDDVVQEESQESFPEPTSPHDSEIDIKQLDKSKEKTISLLEPDSSIMLIPTPDKFSDDDRSFEGILNKEGKESSIALSALKKGTFSLYDVHVPDINTPTLLEIEEDVPRTFVHEKKWVNIPGIGPIVPEEQIKQVENYMKECAIKQGGAVMPRNIRHFQCPPLDSVAKPEQMEKSKHRK